MFHDTRGHPQWHFMECPQVCSLWRHDQHSFKNDEYWRGRQNPRVQRNLRVALAISCSFQLLCIIYDFMFTAFQSHYLACMKSKVFDPMTIQQNDFNFCFLNKPHRGNYSESNGTQALRVGPARVWTGSRTIYDLSMLQDVTRNHRTFWKILRILKVDESCGKHKSRMMESQWCIMVYSCMLLFLPSLFLHFRQLIRETTRLLILNMYLQLQGI